MLARNIPLPRLTEHLTAVCADGQKIPSYMTLWQRATSEQLPHVRREYGRWWFDERHVRTVTDTGAQPARRGRRRMVDHYDDGRTVPLHVLVGK